MADFQRRYHFSTDSKNKNTGAMNNTKYAC